MIPHFLGQRSSTWDMPASVSLATSYVVSEIEKKEQIMNIQFNFRYNTDFELHQQIWGYKVEEKLHVRVREQDEGLIAAVVGLADSNEVMSLTRRPIDLYAAMKMSGTHFSWRPSRSQDNCAVRGLEPIGTSEMFVGSGTRGLRS
jgi:hypothetical protein